MQELLQMPNQINEGLKAKDLESFVNNVFLVDTYKSKMGEDRDVAVLSFRVKDRLPALDLMEFIERGYSFVLDADISSGEESDGQYSVFVEVERDKHLAENIKEVIEGVGKLTGIDNWRFRYHKDWKGKEFSLETLAETIPSSPESYDNYLQETKTETVKGFLDQTMYDDVVVEGNTVTLFRPFSEGLKFQLKDIGDYKTIIKNNSSDLKLDEQAVAETVFLNKIFGDYEIIKLGENFMIRKFDQAMLIKLI
jgi:hypothetical protein